jgi:hypothetical protein
MASSQETERNRWCKENPSRCPTPFPPPCVFDRGSSLTSRASRFAGADRSATTSVRQLARSGVASRKVQLGHTLVV